MGKKKVSWIQLSTGLFDEDDRIKRIEKRPDRDSVMIIWIKLNIQAGRCNAGGTLAFTDVAPLDIEGLSEIFDRPEGEVIRAINLFLNWGMLIKSEDGFYSLPDWEEEQNEDALSKIREKGNERVKKFRERQKEQQQQRSKQKTVPPKSAPEKKPVEIVLPPYDEIIGYYNQAMGKKRGVTDSIKKAIDKLYKKKQVPIEDFKTVIDKKMAEWMGTEHEKHIDPSTLFREDNFDKYLNQPWPKGKGKPHETNKSGGSTSGSWNFVE